MMVASSEQQTSLNVTSFRGGELNHPGSLKILLIILNHIFKFKIAYGILISSVKFYRNEFSLVLSSDFIMELFY